MEYSIIPLPKAEWKGTPILMRYTTEEYYDLELSAQHDGFQVRMVKKRFDTPVTHTPEEYDFPDRLYQDHWEKAEAFGIVREQDEKKELLACIELCPEEWSNRLMVTELWVADELQRRGIGTRLMNLAKEEAARQKRRAIILETQSCNVRAIAFYLSQGFELIGFDSCCYTNRDVERHEIRFDMGYFLHKSSGRWPTEEKL
jgi:GNAT superfamily N-acetyltransferase